MRAKAMAALLLGLGLVSCGGDSISGPPGLGTGNVSASGAVSASGQGVAIFQSVSVGGTSLFQVAVQPGAATGDGVWQLQIARYAERPAVGTYQLVELSATSTDPTANFYYTSAGSMEMFAAVSGELVITSSSPTAVRGTFTFAAESTTNSARTVAVQGSFAAVCPPGATCL
jgi:hypothetical protein